VLHQHPFFFPVGFFYADEVFTAGVFAVVLVAKPTFWIVWCFGGAIVTMSCVEADKKTKTNDATIFVAKEIDLVNCAPLIVLC